MACKVDSCGKDVQWSGLCSVHYERLRRYGDPLFMHDKECAECGGGFRAYHKSARVCSDECKKARERRRELARSPLTCAGCGKPIHKGSSSRTQGEARCRECINGGRGYYLAADGSRRGHGQSAYRAGCRCDVCCGAQSAKAAKWLARYSAEHGEHYSSTWRRAFKAEHGFWPQGSSTGFIDAAGRRAIYERDGWTCRLCDGAIDFDATEHADRASLDHIVPQSRGGSHDPSNLRMAHVGCNARRRDRVDDLEGVS